MHLQYPVPQAIHNKLQHVRIAGVKGVARARVVHVVPWIIGIQLIVCLVVDAAQRKRGAKFTAFT